MKWDEVGKEGGKPSYLQVENHNRVPNPNPNGVRETRSHTLSTPTVPKTNEELNKDNPTTHTNNVNRLFDPPHRPYEIHFTEWRQTSGTHTSPFKPSSRSVLALRFEFTTYTRSPATLCTFDSKPLRRNIRTALGFGRFFPSSLEKKEGGASIFLAHPV